MPTWDGWRHLGSIVAIVTFVTIAGCSWLPAKTGLLEKRHPDTRISSGQLRLWTNDFILDYADRIEEAADRIKAQESSAEIKRNTLLWKINATQAGFRAASQRDALIAFADVWILCHQMTVFFESGPGNDSFGSSQEIAVITARGLEARLEEIRMAMVVPEVAAQQLQEGRDIIGRFADAHPLKSLYFQRAALSGRSDSLVTPDMSTFGGIASGLEVDVMTLQRLLTAYMEYMPTMARWQAELMLADFDRHGLVTDSVSVMKDVPVLVREAMTKQIPQLVSSQMTRALSAVRAERVDALSGLEDMQADTLQFLQRERATVVGEIDRQRVATIQEVSEERKAALKEIQAIARESTGSALSVGKDLIDHLIRKLVMLASVIGLFLLLGSGALMIFLRSRDQRT
jgi:hypothetical protein